MTRYEFEVATPWNYKAGPPLYVVIDRHDNDKHVTEPADLSTASASCRRLNDTHQIVAAVEAAAYAQEDEEDVQTDRHAC